MKDFSIILMLFGIMGVTGVTIPIFVYDKLSFIVNEPVRFFISIFLSMILIGGVMYILTRFKKRG